MCGDVLFVSVGSWNLTRVTLMDSETQHTRRSEEKDTDESDKKGVGEWQIHREHALVEGLMGVVDDGSSLLLERDRQTIAP